VIEVKLAQLLTEGDTTMHPRWLVYFPDNHTEEVYEQSLGKVITKSPEEATSPTGFLDGVESSSRRNSASNSPPLPEPAVGKSNVAPAPAAAPQKSANAPAKKPDDKTTPTSDLDDPNKSASFSNDSKPGSDDSLSNAAKSSREARSKRRQAIIDEVPAALAPIVAPPTGKRKTAGGISSGSKHKKRQRQEPAKDEPVTKVKFLTGTLYIYRGQQRRVEFVRRV
jgi:hypothetical protein